MIPDEIRKTADWLLKVEEFSAARSLALAVTKFLPVDSLEASDFLARTLFKAKDYPAAAEAAQRTLRLAPESTEAKYNAARCLNSSGRPEEAERLARQVIAERPDWVDPRLELGVYLSAQGRSAEALAIFEGLQRTLAAGDPNRIAVEFNLGWHEISRGEFRSGMRKLAGARGLRAWGSPLANRNGTTRLRPESPLQGRRINVLGEGGAGDEIIGARFAATLRQRGAQVTWVTRPELASLLSRVDGIDRVSSTSTSPEPAHDLWIPCMDLPLALDLELPQVPTAPYLTADSKYVRKWESRIKSRSGLRVGVRWQGNPLYENDLMRSIPVPAREALAGIPGVSLFSLQRDDGADGLHPDSPILNVGPELATWEDTAAVVQCLDLVISSCTSVPHLAAAMGKPVWLACPLNPYYTWAMPGERSPWYPTISLFRQTRPRSWDEPMARIFDRLKALTAAPNGGEARIPK